MNYSKGLMTAGCSAALTWVTWVTGLVVSTCITSVQPGQDTTVYLEVSPRAVVASVALAPVVVVAAVLVAHAIIPVPAIAALNTLAPGISPE